MSLKLACQVATVCACMAASDAHSRPTAPCEGQVVSQIQRYCTSSWRNARIPATEWSDCSQQVFLEMLQRMPKRQLETAIKDASSDPRRELNRSIWRISQRWFRSSKRSPKSLNEAAEPQNAPTREKIDSDIEEVSALAKDRLSPRQNRIFKMLVDGNSVADIADQLQIEPARVSSEKYKMIQKLRRVVG